MNKTATIISGLAEVIDNYDAYFIDQWGVLHNGYHAHDGAVAALEYLKERGKIVVLISNSSRPPDVSADMLEGLGLVRNLYDAVLTSGGLTRAYLRDNSKELGRYVRVFDDSGVPSDLLDGLGYEVADSVEDADFLLMARTAMISLASYEADLQRALGRGGGGLRMVCGNPDKVSVGVDGSLHYCPGAVADLYRGMGGDVVIFGKPERPIYDEALKYVGNIDRDRILVIGDSMEHDIAGGVGIGCDGLLIGRGIHRGDLLPLSGERVTDFFRQREIMARYVCEEFCV